MTHEDARNFNEKKFNTTFEAIWKHNIPASHTLVFHYASYQSAVNARKSGIPAHARFGGVPLTLRQPHRTTQSDFEVFNPHISSSSSSADTAALKELDNDDDKMSLLGHKNKLFPNEEVLVLALPRKFLEPLPGYDQDTGLCMVSADMMSAMRPTSFTAVLDDLPWMNGYTLLPPHTILRSFLIMDKSSDHHSALAQKLLYQDRKSLGSTSSTNSVSENNFRLISRSQATTTDESPFLIDCPVYGPAMSSVEVLYVSSIEVYLRAMGFVRQRAFERSLVPLFHYTSPTVASMILQSGLRMSSQGQGDGGVYMSTQGPALYGIGTPDYELNIIKDCFGVERIEEYEGKGKLDIVIVYGCEPSTLQQSPGGRDNAKMISRSTFRDISLEHSDGNYFLRPDRILGAFYIDSSNPVVFSDFRTRAEIIVEKNRERQSLERLITAEEIGRQNTARIDAAVSDIWSSSSEAAQQEQEQALSSSVEDGGGGGCFGNEEPYVMSSAQPDAPQLLNKSARNGLLEPLMNNV
jgi:hypothetical protein